MKEKRNHNLIKALISFVIISIIVVAISLWFISNNKKIGFAFLGIGFLVLVMLKIFKIKIKEVYPDMLFGAIDNGFLVFAAVLGGQIAGVAGAVIGGAAGNTLTDGIGGIFEGHVAEHQRKYKINNLRTSLSTGLGKIAGCLFGAGIGLIILWLVSLF